MSEVNTGTSQPQTPKKGGGLKRLVMFGGVLFVLLTVLVVLLPTIASTGAARDFVLAQAGGSVNGKLSVQGWSLSWFGPITVDALNLTDAAEREVISIQSLSLEKGLWQVLTGGFALGEIRITQPNVLVHYEEDGSPSIAKMFGSEAKEASAKQSDASSESGPLPDISAQLVISKGGVTFSRDGFDAYQINDMNVDITMASLNQIDGDLSMVLGDGKSLAGKVGLKDLAPNNVIDAASASGSATLATDGDVDIAALVSVISGEKGMQGKARLALNVTAEPQNFGVDADVRLINVVSPQVGGKALNLALTGQAGLAGENLSATLELAGSNAKFVALTAQGTLADISAELSTNLAQLRQEIAQAVDLGDMNFSGQAQGTIRLIQADAGGYNTEANLTIKQAGFKSGAQDLQIAELKLDQKGSFATPQAVASSTGKLVLMNVVAGGEQLDQQATVSWSDLVFVGSALTANSLNVTATPLTLEALGLSVDIDAAAIDGGELKLGADLDKTMTLVAAVAGMEEPPALAGRFDLSAQAKAEGAAQSLTGAGSITKLVLGEGDSAVREEKLDLVLNAQVDPKRNSLTLGENRVTSEKISVAVQGKIDDYSGKAVADISGNYELSWPAVTAFLHEFSPNTKELVSVKGKSSSPILLKGPLNESGAKPSFRGLSAGLTLQWDEILLYGIPVSAAKFDPKLDDGQLTVPPSTLSAVQGKVTLGSEIDFRPEDMTLRIPGTTKILDGVQVTTELTEELLSRINPVFYQFVDATGQINLTTQDLVFPFGDSLKDKGAGSGKLELVEMQVKPGGFVRSLVEFAGLGDADELLAVGLRGGEFEIVDGRIAYDDFTLIFPTEFDVKFYGSVAFDDSLDLVVSIPVRADLLAKLGVSGDVQKYAEMLAGSRVDVPLSGTRQQPQLDLSKVDTQKLMEGVMQNVVEEEGGKLLKGLLGGEKTEEEEGGEQKNPLGGLLDQLQNNE